MKSNRYPPEVLDELAGLIEEEGEYVSHTTALSLLGFFQSSCEQFTIVTQRRRRNRTIGPVPLIFITHGRGRPSHTQSVVVGKIAIVVSTIEQTLVDLFADLDHAPDLHRLADILSRVPFQTHTLLHTAGQTSDTALKRVSFMLGWSGRAGSPELPPRGLTRTPIKLDPRISDTAWAWDGRFFTRYPASLLELPLPRPAESTPRDTLERLSFRNHPAVRRRIALTRYIPLYNESDTEYRAWLDELVREILLSPGTASLHAFLSSFTETQSHERRSFPRLLTRHVEANPHLLDSRRQEIQAWTRSHLDSKAGPRIESAIRIACIMEFHEELLSGIARHGDHLFHSGRLDLLQQISARYLDSEYRIPSQMYCIAARIAALETRFDEALSILDRGKRCFEDLDDAELDFGELALAAGEILRLRGRLTEAMAELNLARECFLAAGAPAKIAEADDALGGLMIMRDKPEAARRYYLSALSAAWSSRSVPERASVLAHLGLVEYDLGNVRRAALYLSRAVSLHSMLGNRSSESAAGFSLATMQLAMGHMTKAFRLFKDVHALTESIDHRGGAFESAAFLGWTCDLLGKPGAAASWWSRLPPAAGVEPRIRYTVDLLKARRLLLRGNAASALSEFRALLSGIRERESSDSELGDIYFGIGSCMTRLDMPEAPEMLARALECMTGTPNRIQSRQTRIFAGLMFPAEFSGLPLLQDLRMYPGTNCFDPFWFIYADRLSRLGSREAAELLEHLIDKTPPDLLEMFRTQDRRLDELLNRRESSSTRASQFVTFILNGHARPMHIDNYSEWKAARRPGTFSFDGPSGLIRFETNSASIKPGSIPHRILAQLFLAFPNPVDSAALYASAWGMPYDPECDQAAFKSAILRLNGLLKTVYPGASLCRPTADGAHRAIALNLPCTWEAVL